LLISGLAGSINEAIDRIILKHFTSDPTEAMETVGMYGANYKLAVFMMLYIQMFKYAVEPFFFEQAKNKDAKAMYANVMNYFFVIGLIIFLLITIYIDIFKHFLGSQFHEGIGIVPVVLLANLLLGVFYNLSVWYKINDLTKIGAYITLSGSVITIVFNIVLIPRMGYMGSAVTHLMCYAFMVILSYFLSYKYYFIKYPVGKLLSYLFIALIIYFISTYLLSGLNLILSYTLKTALFALFIIFITFKEKLISTFILKA
jgi:O-antigen/teichoic acid export membrane protein